VLSKSLYKVLQNGDLSDFQRGQIIDMHLAGMSVTKAATLLGVSTAAVSKLMAACTDHGKTSSLERNSGQKLKLSEMDCLTLYRILSKSHRTAAAKVTTELNVHLGSTKSLTRASQIQHA